MIMKHYIAMIATIIISGCSSDMQTKLGIKKTMPDEYQVSKNKTLEVPPYLQNKSVQSNVKKESLSKYEKALLEDIKY
ncbi:MAG: hypothetical protein DGJ47_000056 [Rickettsiaceae bacterium]